MNKVSRIVKVNFDSEWTPPAGGRTIYYHYIEFENGDAGNVGRTSKLPRDMKEGLEIEYSMENNKIKYVGMSGITQGNPNSRENTKSYSKNFQKKAKPEDFLGYAYSYAKDLVVAGKTKKEDIKNLKEIAEEIYYHIAEILQDKKDDQ